MEIKILVHLLLAFLWSHASTQFSQRWIVSINCPRFKPIQWLGLTGACAARYWLGIKTQRPAVFELTYLGLKF